MEAKMCPKCGSNNVSIERRINGNCRCSKCGYSWKNEVSNQNLDLESTLRDLDSFVDEMKSKLTQKHVEGRKGYRNMSNVELSKMLRDHVEKGDPIDVANFCMFIYSNKQRIGK